MYFLGLPFVDGVTYVKHDGWDFFLPNAEPCCRRGRKVVGWKLLG